MPAAKNLCLICAFLSCFARTSDVAAGYGISPKADAMQNAVTAVADEPWAVFYNPAGLTQIRGTEIQVGFSALVPDISYSNGNIATSTKSVKKAYAPSAFLSTDAAKPLALGFGLYAPAARGLDFTQNAATLNLPHRFSILRVDFVPSAALRLGRFVSVGAGVVGSYVQTNSNILGLEESANGYGFSAQGGVLIKPTKRLALGLNYRGPMNAQMNGTGTLVGSASDDFTLDLKFPGALSVGLAAQLADQFLLAFDFVWEMSSYVDEIRRNYSEPAYQAVSVAPLDSEDSFALRLGSSYQAWPAGEWRFGYSYTTAAVPAANLVPAVPSYDIHAFSVGYGHEVKKWRFDIGYEFAHMPARQGTNVLFPGTYDMMTHSVFTGVAYRFGKSTSRYSQK